jgi:hypothetical protein
MEMCNFQPAQKNQSQAWILRPRLNTAILQLYLALLSVVWSTSPHKNLLVNNALVTVYISETALRSKTKPCVTFAADHIAEGCIEKAGGEWDPTTSPKNVSLAVIECIWKERIRDQIPSGQDVLSRQPIQSVHQYTCFFETRDRVWMKSAMGTDIKHY